MLDFKAEVEVLYGAVSLPDFMPQHLPLALSCLTWLAVRAQTGQRFFFSDAVGTGAAAFVFVLVHSGGVTDAALLLSTILIVGAFKSQLVQ